MLDQNDALNIFRCRSSLVYSLFLAEVNREASKQLPLFWVYFLSSQLWLKSLPFSQNLMIIHLFKASISQREVDDLRLSNIMS